MTEKEMVGWHHRLNGHEFGQDLGASDGQGLVYCSPWGHKKSDMTGDRAELNREGEKQPKLIKKEPLKK